MGKVFISYSHDSPEHSARVLSLAWALRNNGIDVELDQFHTEEILDWPRWCNEQTSHEHSDFVVCVCTPEYRRRIDGNVPPEKGKGVYWEGALLDDDLYDEKGNKRIVPILLDGTAESSIPRFLRGWTHSCIKEFKLTDAGFEHLVRILTRQIKIEKNELGPVPVLPTKRAPTASPSSGETGVRADISRILKYAPAELIGRENELKLLNDTWAKVQNHEKGRPHVLTFVALGGEGKTSLVAKWAAELAAQDWPGCDTAFAWSFYSQGTREQVAASSDLFLKEALNFFALNDKDREFAAGNAGAFEKGQKLARLAGERRTLLILDGLEPLQYAPTSPTPGQLKDQGITALLRGLATASHGLCIVTTRYSLPDLKAFWQTTAPEVKLLRLSRDAGVHLLKTLGVKGTAKEFETLVEDVKGHALTLTLLGGFLKRAFRGDIRQRDRVKFEKADAQMDGGHAFRTMAAYEEWLLRDGGDEGQREVAVLRLMGLFDRPADASCLAALRSETIPGLTQPLAGLAEDDWEYCLSGLETAKLITVNRDATGALVSLDAHPHLREYFAKQLREKNLDAWCAAHRRLYEHLCATTKEGDQPTLEELQPLYQAVAHGCQAGLEREAWSDVYSDRIMREDEYYSAYKLGALGSNLGAIACFFTNPWSGLSAAFSESDQGSLLNHAAYHLRAFGRLIESLAPTRSSMELAAKCGHWQNASIGAGSLCELELMLGDVAGAVGDAEQSVSYADHSGEWSEKMKRRATHAHALHQAGLSRRNVGKADSQMDAEARFREAEQMHKHMGDIQLLYSVRGFNYCDLLLADAERAAWRQCSTGVLFAGSPGVPLGVSSGETPPEIAAGTAVLRSSCRAVSQRAVRTLEIAEVNNWLLDTALDHLTLGRAALFAAILGCSDAPSPFSPEDQRRGGAAALETTRRELDIAVSGLRRAGTTHHIPSGLLTRSWFRFLINARSAHESAQADLDEAWEIAERGPMKLHMANIHLYRARLFFREAKYPWESPAADLAAAEKIINHETTFTREDGTIIKARYARRDEELADAKQAILGK